MVSQPVHYDEIKGIENLMVATPCGSLAERRIRGRHSDKERQQWGKLKIKSKDKEICTFCSMNTYLSTLHPAIAGK